jgi:hypothetical protein
MSSVIVPETGKSRVRSPASMLITSMFVHLTVKEETVMKRRITRALAVLVVALVAVGPAEATYLGTLATGDYTLEVQTAAKVAITILVVTSRGRLEVEEVLLFDPSTPGQTLTIRRNVARIILVADALQGGTGLVKINQGTPTSGGPTLFEVPVAPHDDIVIDVIP